jgi:hypothetical protein
MKNRRIAFVLGFAALAIPAIDLAARVDMAFAQPGPPSAPSPLPLPPQLEKDLAARAANVTEVTLNKDMLGFAAKFMDRNDRDQAAVNQLIQGLDGIYVRDYEFDKEGEYSMDDIEKLRQAIETPEWTPMVREREQKGKETTDVLVKQVNGETKGMFVLSAEPRELSIVLILGNIRMDQLGELGGLGGLGALSGVDANVRAQEMAKEAQMRAAEKAREALQKTRDAEQKARDAQEKARDAQEKAKEAPQKAQDAGKDGTQ